MAEPELPCCVVRSPDCGACGDELSHDGDSFYCETCHLDYGDGRETDPATFRDEDEEPCGADCDDPWHASEMYGAWECTPCVLPASHTSDHCSMCVPIVGTPR